MEIFSEILTQSQNNLDICFKPIKKKNDMYGKQCHLLGASVKGQKELAEKNFHIIDEKIYIIKKKI